MSMQEVTELKTQFGVSELLLQFELTDGYDMMHKAWSSMEEVP